MWLLSGRKEQMNTATAHFPKQTSNVIVRSVNTISFIHAYRLQPPNNNLWAFDDEKHGLIQELFLHEASNFISKVVGDSNFAALTFSEVHFPKANCILRRTWNGDSPQTMGCEYLARSPISNSKDVIEVDGVWLCPAMMHYFKGPNAPEFIYGLIERSVG